MGTLKENQWPEQLSVKEIIGVKSVALLEEQAQS